MKIETGNRRIFVITEGLVALLAISAMGIIAPAHAVGVLTVTGGAVGILLSFYFRADGLSKVARASLPAEKSE